MLALTPTHARRFWRLLSVAVAWFAVTFSTNGAADETRNVALFVGVTRYNHAQLNATPLSFPESDAEALGAVLQASGYSVSTLLGRAATQTAVREALTRVQSQGTADGVVVIGLWGHGVQYGDDAYFCPFDARVRPVVDSQGQALRDRQGRPRLEPDPESLISMRELLDTLLQCGAGHRVLLADCCRDDPSAARGGAFGSNLRVADLQDGMAALFACSESECAFEHRDWGHGAFTKALLECLEQAPAGRAVTANEISVDLRTKVSALVETQSAGRDRQTVNPIVNGVVDLQIRRTLVGRRAGDVRMVGSLELPLIWCPPGEFLSGSAANDPDAAADERPQQQVTVRHGYWLGQTEVTQQQWTRVMGNSPWRGKRNVREGARFPAVHISHEAAEEFSRTLTRRERQGGSLPEDWEFVLPSEVEWERACRAETTTRFSFGDAANDLPQHAWYGQNAHQAGEAYAHEVAGRTPNPWGLCDMHGNVWEWCASSDEQKPYRGGSWMYPAGLCRSASRGTYAATEAYNDLGFRVALRPVTSRAPSSP